MADKRRTEIFAAIKDLTEPSSIKCCCADELYELRPGLRYFRFDYESKKFGCKKDYGRIKNSGGVDYMHKVWILDIQDSEEILRAKKASGKIKNVARGKGLGNEKVLLSKYQLQEEKDSLTNNKKMTECSISSGMKEVGESIMIKYSRTVPKRAAQMTEVGALLESSSSMVPTPSKVPKLVGEASSETPAPKLAAPMAEQTREISDI